MSDHKLLEYMPRKKRNKSIEDFKNEFKRIENLLSGLITIIEVLNQLSVTPLFKGMSEHFRKQYPFLEFGKDKIDSIYELGFIRLYASFEAFMYEFLKEMYIKYPKSIPIDKKISIGEIIDWKTKKSVNEFIIDHVAIENSYDLQTWERTLNNSFKIEVFNNKEQKTLFDTLNLCRNMLVHSGSKTNSKVVRDFNNLFPDTHTEESKDHFTPKKWKIFDERLYRSLQTITMKIVHNIEGKYSCLAE
jgi:hypothetical protein